MASTNDTDHVQFCRPRHLPGVELVSVAYRDRQFPEHHHDEFVIGAITAGAEMLTVAGRSYLADRGSVLRLRPGEAHANATHGAEMLRYEVLYVPVAVFDAIVPAPRPLGFASPVVRDARLHNTVRTVHRTLRSRVADRLEQESALGALAGAIGLEPADAAPHAEHSPIAGRVRDYIDAHLADDFGLEQLSQAIGASPFHLVRVFKRSVGLSPLAYRNQRRLAEARKRLGEGQAAVQVALDLGYADQSHFIRQFQRVVGTSPGRYAREVAG